MNKIFHKEFAKNCFVRDESFSLLHRTAEKKYFLILPKKIYFAISLCAEQETSILQFLMQFQKLFLVVKPTREMIIANNLRVNPKRVVNKLKSATNRNQLNGYPVSFFLSRSEPRGKRNHFSQLNFSMHKTRFYRRNLLLHFGFSLVRRCIFNAHFSSSLLLPLSFPTSFKSPYFPPSFSFTDICDY